MNERTIQWLQQADYGMETAEFMYEGGRFFYAVFMCHLSAEKALKALYQEKVNRIPPKTHNLVYLLQEIDLKPQETIGKFIVKLNEASVATRYPEELEKLKRDYTKEIVKDIIKKKQRVTSVDKASVLEISTSFRIEMEAQGIAIDRLVLFGSFASGQWHQESDIDLVVVSSDFKGCGYWERIDLLTNAIYNVSAPIEAVAMTPDEWNRKESFVIDYAHSGEVIYEKTVIV